MSFVALALSIAVQPPVIVPGKSLGTIELGMTLKQLESRFTVKPGAIESWRRIGDFEVQIHAGKVVAIGLEMGKAGKQVQVKNGPTLRPRSPQQLARLLPGCGPLQRNRGGNIIQCTGGAVVGEHLGGMMVRVVMPSFSTKSPACADYLEPGRSDSKLEIQAGKTYCLPSRTVTTALRPDDVLGKLRYNTCKTQVNVGATTVTCPFQGTRFIFAGPGAALHRVEGVPLKE